ncbi:MAG: glycerol dehydratase [Rhodospirillaceae bacterium]|jgi:propanediol dehydratase small subunit|nr:glycerol dehydratase [Rhodospirillaceae bacterium]MBT5245129.1 glycerol dehydratase [Rhodospirillaceae bacterium]MBT5562006.1 glycerol dehydratase [Rhodospirillaceae bacterium]MBT6242179.1 glycerol dehydratase [Rhodospirillaceae bacterium]MBT7136648.1 glycerol dehydratase [Rhodospirillaceae bacterium]
MTGKPLSAADYPLAEKRSELVKGARGKHLDDLTLDGVVSGDVTMEDLRITPEALHQQAEIARAVGRGELAQNFERASEMARIPQPVIMEMYEMLRPGRASDKQALINAAQRLRAEFQADILAAFIEEAADVYENRGLFTARY